MEINLFDIVLAKANQPMPSGWSFSKEDLTRIANCNRKPIFGTYAPENARFIIRRDDSIEICNITHGISNLHMDGDQLVGDVMLVDTESGRELQDYFDGKVGFNIYAAFSPIRHPLYGDVENIKVTNIDVVISTTKQ